MTSKSARSIPSARLTQDDVGNTEGDDMGQVQTSVGSHKPDARSEISKDAAEEFKFELVATNGQTIAVSKGYTTKEDALNGIESVKRNAAAAVIEDKTI